MLSLKMASVSILMRLTPFWGCVFLQSSRVSCCWCSVASSFFVCGSCPQSCWRCFRSAGALQRHPRLSHLYRCRPRLMRLMSFWCFRGRSSLLNLSPGRCIQLFCWQSVFMWASLLRLTWAWILFLISVEERPRLVGVPWVAAVFAAVSALSFPLMLQCDGIHMSVSLFPCEMISSNCCRMCCCRLFLFFVPPLERAWIADRESLRMTVSLSLCRRDRKCWHALWMA